MINLDYVFSCIAIMLLVIGRFFFGQMFGSYNEARASYEWEAARYPRAKLREERLTFWVVRHKTFLYVAWYLCILIPGLIEFIINRAVITFDSMINFLFNSLYIWLFIILIYVVSITFIVINLWEISRPWAIPLPEDDTVPAVPLIKSKREIHEKRPSGEKWEIHEKHPYDEHLDIQTEKSPKRKRDWYGTLRKVGAGLSEEVSELGSKKPAPKAKGVPEAKAVPKEGIPKTPGECDAQVADAEARLILKFIERDLKEIDEE